MTKEQFIKRWSGRSDLFKKDLEAVIANEIAKSQEAKLKHADQVTDQVTDHEQPLINIIAEAYERGEKIRRKNWYITHWIKKHSDTEAIDEPKNIYDVTNWAFRTEPHEWELYTEPAEQVIKQEQPAKPFDKDRFEAMFRAVVASGLSYNEFLDTENILKKLDAYYATKEGGNNGI